MRFCSDKRVIPINTEFKKGIDFKWLNYVLIL